jgi:hypothetical protein
MSGLDMPRRAAGLSARKVETVKAPGMFADGGGLLFAGHRNGRKTWIFEVFCQSACEIKPAKRSLHKPSFR